MLGANLGLVANALRESSYTAPKLHVVWEYVLQRTASAEGEATAEHTNFVGKFWREIVEGASLGRLVNPTLTSLTEDLFNLSATYARKYLGFQLFEKMLPLLDVKTVRSHYLASLTPAASCRFHREVHALFCDERC